MAQCRSRKPRKIEWCTRCIKGLQNRSLKIYQSSKTFHKYYAENVQQWTSWQNHTKWLKLAKKGFKYAAVKYN